MGCCFLLQGIFPIQESNLGLLHYRKILYGLSYKGSPSLLVKLIKDGTVVKSLPDGAGDPGGVGSILGWGRSPGEGNSNPLQYSCLENSMNSGAWWATVLGVSGSQT